jgi:hypothetical protein
MKTDWTREEIERLCPEAFTAFDMNYYFHRNPLDRAFDFMHLLLEARLDLERANENYLEQSQISERLNGELEAANEKLAKWRTVIEAFGVALSGIQFPAVHSIFIAADLAREALADSPTDAAGGGE